MYSWLDPDDFGKLHLPEYRKAKQLAIEGEVIPPGSARPADYVTAFRALTSAVDRLADRMDQLEQSPVLGLPGAAVVRALRSGNAQINAVSFDE